MPPPPCPTIDELVIVDLDSLTEKPRRIRLRVISAKKRSTILSQEAEVGVKCR